jgi:hypothetical protein
VRERGVGGGGGVAPINVILKNINIYNKKKVKKKKKFKI